ncbi:uncharacterized protein K489DRAFT_381763 [Dissoconium aciculare CBS 342.82]|uniref:Uncharacterized protein n=1 Tax=Dissoconium aciculare CBS 342.82 TaxID=1314786 RepID=A0A6J3M175_9PEZI|nr:uncharacterized protein K489DRAFT_381763 [Dissoconium aciculare CBS 342.82]KAF1821771.1 hypothetical protein K489DRAFT_381763 [Dissoconium aciculare CBS 342.82]
MSVHTAPSGYTSARQPTFYFPFCSWEDSVMNCSPDRLECGLDARIHAMPPGKRRWWWRRRQRAWTARRSGSIRPKVTPGVCALFSVCFVSCFFVFSQSSGGIRNLGHALCTGLVTCSVATAPCDLPTSCVP